MQLNISSAIKVVLMCAFFIGFYTGADQQPVSEATANEATVTVPEVKTDTAIFKVPEVKVDKPERNGFVTLYLEPTYYFDIDRLYLLILTGYGVVMGQSNIADAGILEGTMNVSGVLNNKGWALGFNIGTEINFVKNNGMNTLIPGLMLTVGIGYAHNLQSKSDGDGLGGRLDLGFYLKAFVSKQFALIPYLEGGYGISSGVYQKGVGVLRVGLGLRQYF